MLLELGGIILFGWVLLEHFDVVSLDANRHGSLDRIDGNDEGVVACARLENALDPVESSATNTYALADFQKGVAATGDILSEQYSNRLNLFFGDRRTFATLSDESHNTIVIQDSYPGLVGRYDPDKHVAGKQWQLYFLTAIAPFVDFRNDGQIVRDAFHLQLMCDGFLVS